MTYQLRIIDYDPLTRNHGLLFNDMHNDLDKIHFPFIKDI